MTSRKLSESDKKKILELYHLPGETTSTLADRYGVSNSTISRILKNNLPEAEYEALIQQKRGRPQSSLAEVPDVEEAPTPIVNEVLEIPLEESQLEIKLPSTGKPAPPVRRSRRRSSLTTETVDESNSNGQVEALPLSDLPQIIELVKEPIASETDPAYSEAAVLEEILDEEFLDQEEELEDDEDLEDDDLDDDLEDGDLEDGSLLVSSREGKTFVQVLPLTEASLPRTCYLVVDRSAELIARPLRDFGDLGQIPEVEIQEKTLPVFDNHRVAKRYSNPRTQRVIKLPDGRVLQKTSSHLQAKGITRLLIDGQVYSLS